MWEWPVPFLFLLLSLNSLPLLPTVLRAQEDGNSSRDVVSSMYAFLTDQTACSDRFSKMAVGLVFLSTTPVVYHLLFRYVFLAWLFIFSLL